MTRQCRLQRAVWGSGPDRHLYWYRQWIGVAPACFAFWNPQSSIPATSVWPSSSGTTVTVDSGYLLAYRINALIHCMWMKQRPEPLPERDVESSMKDLAKALAALDRAEQSE